MKKNILFLLLGILILSSFGCKSDEIIDFDNDGIVNAEDNCPNVANPDQTDTNEDGVGDVCQEMNASFKPCEGGTADGYPCNGYGLLSHVTFGSVTNSRASGNDSWGWTDPTNNKEYAIMGLSTGTAFVDISDSVNPVILGFLPTATESSSWRDIKVYSNHVFIVSEASNHGLQVFNLERLRDVTDPPQTFSADAHFTEFGSAHNIAINEESGYAYVIGANQFSGGPIFININNPTNPVAEGGYAGANYSHDAQIVNYTGPDPDYIGKEIFFGSNENRIAIVDVTDKANPVLIQTMGYSNVQYTHQGWLTNDNQYFLVGDELDESREGFNTRTIVFDVSDLNNPSVHMTYTADNSSIDHNGYVIGNTYFLASYTAGLRLIDISDIDNQNMLEVGFFDAFPSHNNTQFAGTWNVYPFFGSGHILISNIEGDLFIVKAN